jgi:hypothetical protein
MHPSLPHNSTVSIAYDADARLWRGHLKVHGVVTEGDVTYVPFGGSSPRPCQLIDHLTSQFHAWSQPVSAEERVARMLFPGLDYPRALDIQRQVYEIIKLAREEERDRVLGVLAGQLHNDQIDELRKQLHA